MHTKVEDGAFHQMYFHVIGVMKVRPIFIDAGSNEIDGVIPYTASAKSLEQIIEPSHEAD
jgi:hypothetical protein